MLNNSWDNRNPARCGVRDFIKKEGFGVKKIVSVVIAIIMCMTVGCSFAEDVSFASMQQAIELAERTDLKAGTADYAGIVVQYHGQYYRVTAIFDEQAKEMAEELAGASEDDAVKLEKPFEAYVMSLPVTVEAITAVPKTDEELESYVGKTLEELQSDHFEWFDGELIGTVSCKPAVWRVTCDMFVYDLTLRSSQGKCEAYEIYRGKESLANEIVEEITYVGLSQHAADMAYAADGSEVPYQLWMGDPDVMVQLQKLLKKKGFSGETVDELISVLEEISSDEYAEIGENADLIDPYALFEYLQIHKDRQPGEPEPPPAKPNRR